MVKRLYKKFGKKPTKKERIFFKNKLNENKFPKVYKKNGYRYVSYRKIAYIGK